VTLRQHFLTKQNFAFKELTYIPMSDVTKLTREAKNLRMLSHEKIVKFYCMFVIE